MIPILDPNYTTSFLVIYLELAPGKESILLRSIYTQEIAIKEKGIPKLHSLRSEV